MRSLLLLTLVSIIESAVLDPALFLAPSPPLRTTHENVPENLWKGTMEARMNKRADVITDMPKKSMELMEGAETFWPSYTARLRGIHIPLTFHLTGTYGGMHGGNSGSVLASSYMSHGVSGLRGVLAGNRGTGVRIFASEIGPSWSGWGNGKWGHYGKG
ncbi:unnamed protein product [Danaus chrysippus]|uniref:(African queen) hypothetical protein n=1 Tax=Danaus chrysippus TaxID=151541 RepID=A0A8J2QIR1_9NEOP|nr:unnamed protein product [Danaus chrysippus]